MTANNLFPKFVPLLALPASLAILNFALSFHNLWPTPWITIRPEISIEIAVLVLALALYAEWRGPLSRTAVAWLSGLVMLFALARYAEVTAPALYGRAVNIYWDLPRIPDVAAMLVDVAPAWLLVLGALGLIAVLGLAFALIALSLTAVTRSFAKPVPRRATAGVMVLVIGLFAAGHSSLPVNTLSWYSLPLTLTYKEQIGFVAEAFSAPPVPADSTSLRRDYGLEAVAGSDVIFAFIESYGAVVYDEPSLQTATRAGREQLAEALAATDRSVVSALVRSPTFGGVSWLAHASFMTGLQVTDNGQYNLLLTRDINSLPRIFRRHGYRSVAVMPGMKREWPEGASFYGFDKLYGEQALDYTGPEFGWWRIPDQFSLARLEALELGAGERAPVAAFFETINTHLPFQPLPPLQRDWERLLSDDPFAMSEVEASLNEAPDWSNLRPAYARAIDYTYRYWREFFIRHGERPLTTVLIGDHQPPASVSGQGARWDVPVHVITDNPAITQRLLNAGFVPGLVPDTEFIGPMHELVHTLLASFSGAEHADQGKGQGAGRRDGEQGEQNGP